MARAMARGRYQGEQLNFEAPADFFGQLSELRWEIVRALQGQGAVGIRELARRVARDVRRVHDDVSALTELGLLERTAKGQVRCPFDDIHVDMHLRASAA
jgi:predicted transcriptional regulator